MLRPNKNIRLSQRHKRLDRAKNGVRKSLDRWARFISGFYIWFRTELSQITWYLALSGDYFDHFLVPESAPHSWAPRGLINDAESGILFSELAEVSLAASESKKRLTIAGMTPRSWQMAFSFCKRPLIRGLKTTSLSCHLGSLSRNKCRSPLGKRKADQGLSSASSRRGPRLMARHSRLTLRTSFGYAIMLTQQCRNTRK